MADWIDVKKALPGKAETVFVTDGDASYAAAFRLHGKWFLEVDMMSAENHDGGCHIALDSNVKISHWMPIPGIDN